MNSGKSGRRWRRGVWNIWYNLQQDLARLHCDVAGDARAELSQHWWCGTLSRSQRRGLSVATCDDDAGWHILSHRHRTIRRVDGGQEIVQVQ